MINIATFTLLPLTQMTKQEFITAVENNATTKQLKAVAEKYGYAVSDYPLITEYGDIKVYIYAQDRSFRNFKPEFYLETNFLFAHNREDSKYTYTWKVGTISYGSLNGEELEQYVKGINEAKALYDELVKIDLTKLEVRPETFED